MIRMSLVTSGGIQHSLGKVCLSVIPPSNRMTNGHHLAVSALLTQVSPWPVLLPQVATWPQTHDPPVTSCPPVHNVPDWVTLRCLVAQRCEFTKHSATWGSLRCIGFHHCVCICVSVCVCVFCFVCVCTWVNASHTIYLKCIHKICLFNAVAKTT